MDHRRPVTAIDISRAPYLAARNDEWAMKSSLGKGQHDRRSDPRASAHSANKMSAPQPADRSRRQRPASSAAAIAARAFSSPAPPARNIRPHIDADGRRAQQVDDRCGVACSTARFRQARQLPTVAARSPARVPAWSLPPWPGARLLRRESAQQALDQRSPDPNIIACAVGDDRLRQGRRTLALAQQVRRGWRR